MEESTGSRHRERWGLILAGGEGVRLRPLTRVIAGDERPKQFCTFLGRETFFELTRRRADLAIPRGQTLAVLTHAHERFYRPLIAGMPHHCAVIQPEDRGTATAIFYGLLRIAAIAPMASVAILPSDHYVSDDVLFMGHVAAAFSMVRARADLVVLLGVAPESAETQYGWIEPGESVPGTGLHRVNRFWEKPTLPVARTLLERGCLWNSFVMVARITALLALIRHALPILDAEFALAQPMLGTTSEAAAVRTLYSSLTPRNFSEDILAAAPLNLAVLPMAGVQWSDWGTPERIIATLDRLGVTPEWKASLARASA